MTGELTVNTTPWIDSVRRESPLWAACTVALMLLWILMRGGQFNLLCALMIGTGLILAAIRRPAMGAILTIAYLHLLGDVRRLADTITDIPSFDLLLLVAPVIALFLALPSLLRLSLKDKLSKTMLWLMVLMFAEIFNPSQGGLAVGFSGAMFYLVPVLWFWIGRSLASPRVVETLLYKVIFPLAVFAALLGLMQTLVGFFPYQQTWINATIQNYTALSLGRTTRAFGFSVSAAEYATLLEFAAAGVAAAWFGRRRVWVLAFPLLLGAMLLASGRTVVVKLLFALILAWTLRKRTELTGLRMLRLGAMLGAGLICLTLVAGKLIPSGDASSMASSATGESIAHLTGGLAHPFDSHFSTLGIHQEMLLKAIGGSFLAPLGHGLGAPTGAASKFADSGETFSSEIDVGDMFVALGPIGGVLYIVLFLLAMRSAIQYVLRVRLTVSLPVVAILSSTVAAWLISGQYSTSALLFFLIGATAYTQPGVATNQAVAFPEAEPKESGEPEGELQLA